MLLLDFFLDVPLRIEAQKFFVIASSVVLVVAIQPGKRVFATERKKGSNFDKHNCRRCVCFTAAVGSTAAGNSGNCWKSWKGKAFLCSED